MTNFLKSVLPHNKRRYLSLVLDDVPYISKIHQEDIKRLKDQTDENEYYNSLARLFIPDDNNWSTSYIKIRDLAAPLNRSDNHNLNEDDNKIYEEILGDIRIKLGNQKKEADEEGESGTNTKRSGIEIDGRREFQEVEFDYRLDQLVVDKGEEAILD